jgi:hypothetical protein
MSGVSLILNRKLVEKSYRIEYSDSLIACDTAINPITLILPDASKLDPGHYFIIKDEGGNADVNIITITGKMGQTIDGEESIIVSNDYTSISIYSNGKNKWFIF